MAESAATSTTQSRLSQDTKYDLFQLLLPNDHAHTSRGKSVVWEKHFQSQNHHQRQQPTRPQTGGRIGSGSSPGYSGANNLLVSPRQIVSACSMSLQSQQHQERAASVTPRCKSASVVRACTATSPRTPQSPSLQNPADHSHHHHAGRPSIFKRPLPSTTISALSSRQIVEEPNSSPVTTATTTISLNVNPRSREHLELKACMLAYKHKIDVDALQQIKEQAQQEIERIKVQKFVTQSGTLDDGSDFETMKRKTSFLLHHFFSLDDHGASPRQERLLYDIVEDWMCSESASPTEVSRVWTSITNHIEQSYILRRKLVANSDPDRVSIVIALDCLRKLTLRLPEYQRVLNVALCIIESGLCVNKSKKKEILVPPDDEELQQQQQQQAQAQARRFYFEEFQELMDALEEARALVSRTNEQNSLYASLSIREQISKLLPQLSDDEPLEKEALFLTFLHSNMETLACLACNELLKHFFQHENAEKKSFFYSMLMNQLTGNETKRVLQEITNTHLKEFQGFLQENLDAMDTILMDTATSSSTSTDAASHTIEALSPTSAKGVGHQHLTSQPLFQRLIERHPSEFAAILWQSPFLTAHIFQDSQYLVARILEQNIFLVSQVLLQRQDVLLSLLNHALKDSAAVLAEFLLNHPRGLTDFLANHPTALADAMKANPGILSELLISSQATFGKVLLSTPGTLSHILKTTPELLAQVFRDDPSLLALAFSLVPHLLSDTLEKRPEFFLDIAHRKPVLVTRLFAKYPDLLMEPLESNPTLFSNFLVYHRKVLPDLSDPDFNPMLFQLESKKFSSTGTQTHKNLAKFTGKLRIREKLELQEREMLALTQPTKASSAPIPSSSVGTGSGQQRKDSPKSQSQIQRKDSAMGRQQQVQRKDSATMTLSQQMQPQLSRKDSNSAQQQLQQQQRKDLATASELVTQRKNSYSTRTAQPAPSLPSSSEPISQSHRHLSIPASDSTGAGLPILTPTEVVQEIARIYVKKISADAQDNAAGGRARQSLVAFTTDAYIQELGFKALAQKKLARLLISAKHASHTQEKVRIKWFLRFANATIVQKGPRLHRVALDFYLLVLQKLIPLDQMQLCLEDEPYHACLIPYPTMKELVDDPLIVRLLVDKDQRQQLLMLQISERDALGTPNITTAKRRDSALPSQLQQSTAMAMLHVDDILDSTMNVWLQYQARVREEWSVLFQRINPDGSGVVHFTVFVALVRSKLAFLDDRMLMKAFHTCGEENELGEFALLPEDFTLAMFVLQEQEALRQFSPQV